MHLQDKENGFYGSVPIVAGTVPLALGAALSAKFDSSGDVAVAYFGDGAVEEGVIHECFNLAVKMQLPVVFVIENNFFASHLHISERQPNASTSRFGQPNFLNVRIVDGNDVCAVHEASQQLVNSARHNCQPSILEAFTYRWRGHVDWKEDEDVGVSRSKEEIDNWKRLCPLERLKDEIIKNKLLSAKALMEAEERENAIIGSAWKSSLSAPYADQDSFLNHVYFEGKK